MVIAIKSLFNTLPLGIDIPEFFNRCTDIIKQMNMKQLYMCLSLIRIQNHKIIVSSAGMPPILHYVKQNNEVNEILLKGMPLGAAANFPYNQEEFEVKSGDTLLLMTDGFMELFNEKNEIYDLQRIRAVFNEYAHLSSEEIIKHLNSAADKWRNGTPIHDDMTFVVLKFEDK